MGRGQINRAFRFPMHEQETDRADFIGDVDPRHALTTATQRPANEKAEGQRQHGQRAALSTEYNAGSDHNPSNAQRLDRGRRCFPIHRDARQEVVAEFGALMDHLITARPVVPHRLIA